MIPRNIGSYIKPKVAITPAASAAATIKGISGGAGGIDRFANPGQYGASGQVVTNGLPISATLFGIVGALANTPSTTSVIYKIQDSVDDVDGDYADSVDAAGTALAMTALTAAASDGRLDFDMTGLKRWVRVVATVAFTGGSSPTAVVGATLILGGTYEGPHNYV